jgi:isopenicillin N synthase-like dioxygenase
MSGLASFREIPIVDVSSLVAGDLSASSKTVQELRHAAQNVGFLYVTGHGVPQRLFDELLRVTKAFFALPLERKMSVYIGLSRNHRGYVPVGEEVFYGGTTDLKEAFDLAMDLPNDPDYLAGNPLLGPNQWPDLPGFADAVRKYYDATLELGCVLLRGFALAMGEEAHAFDAWVRKPPSQLRLIHYPFNPNARDATGIGAHTDYECFTLLYPTAPGLEVLNGAGEWIDVPPLPGAYVINLGDMMELLTNGEFVATSHRVRRVQEERYSFPLFFAFDYHTRVEPLPRFVSDSRPARPALVAGEHLYAQTVQSFRYLQERLARGEIALPERAMPLSSFGQEARQRARLQAVS